MHHIALVAVVHGREYLLYYLCGINFTELLLLSYLIEELATVTEFGHQEITFLVLKELVKFQNVGVIKLL